MADLTITAANVLKGSNAVFATGIAGDTITAGQVLYLDSTTGKYKLADSDSATEAARKGGYIALNGASDGQPIAVMREGDVTIGATLTAGTTYYLSDTPGGIAPIADLATGDYYCIVGIAKSASILSVAFHYSGVAA